MSQVSKEVHNADKEVPVIKPSSSPVKTDFVTDIRNFHRGDKKSKVPAKNCLVYLEKKKSSESISRALFDKYANKYNIYPNKTKRHMMIYSARKIW